MTTTWSQLPGRPTETASTGARSLPARFALTWLLVAPIAAAVTADRGGALAVIALTGAGAAGAVATSSQDRWFVAPLVMGLAGVVNAVLFGPVTGGVVIWTGLIACWAVLDRHPSPVATARPSVIAPLAGMTLLGALISLRFAPFGAIVGVALVTVTALISAAAPQTVDRVGHAVEGGASWMARAVVAVMLGLIGVVLILVPWTVQRVFRWDPTWVPRRNGTRWVEVGAAATNPRRLWDPDSRVLRTTPGRRFHRLVLTVSCLAIAGLLAGMWAFVQQREAQQEIYDSPALADSPWWPSMNAAMDVAYGRSPISSYVGVLPIDASAPDFHVTDRRRQTWRPPIDAACPPIRLWMFGGSALFGMGQRDDHTIASELARLAWDDGIALEIDNWGVPGDTYWMEGRRLELALSEGEPPPDRAIFYDGPNDWRVQAQLNASKRGGKLLFANDLDWNALPSIQRRNERLADLLEITRDGPDIGKEPQLQLPPDGIGAYAAKGYAAASDLLQPKLADAGIASIHFYQPSRVTRVPARASEAPRDPANEEFQAQIEAAFRADLPEDVVDLSGAMDGSDQPVYWDEVHTNEVGARLVAEAMWVELQDDLAVLSEQKGQGSCR